MSSFSQAQLNELLDKIDQEATDKEDNEIPNEYYEAVWETTSRIRRELGLYKDGVLAT